MELVADIETDGLLKATEEIPELTRIHCIVAKDRGTGKVFRFGPDELDAGVALLAQADTLIGHNFQAFDVPALQRFYPDFKPKAVVDTLVLSRLLDPEMDPVGFVEYDHQGQMVMGANGHPKRRYESHSLRAWGVRLSVAKGDYGRQHGFAEYTPAMLDYCAQDVEVNEVLYAHFLKEGIPPLASAIEHPFAKNIGDMTDRGVAFRKDKALALLEQLQVLHAECRDALVAMVPPVEEVVVLQSHCWISPEGQRFETKAEAPASWRKSLRPGPKKTKTVVTPFNPTSRHQVAKLFKDKYGWLPEAFTPTGEPKLSGEVLEDLDYPEAVYIAKLFDIEKRMSVLDGGPSSLIQNYRDGRVYGRVNHNGTPTARCKHSAPNLGNQTSLRKWLGKEIRGLFVPSEGRRLVGCDAERGELVMFAHYLYQWDKGAYAEVVSSGDIHTVNQKAAGLATRDEAKTFIYRMLYGGGPFAVGDSALPPESEWASLIRKYPKLATRFRKQWGKKSTQEVKDRYLATCINGVLLKQRFLENIVGYRELEDAVKAAAERGYLIGLDGRRLRVRYAHAALNTLLQGALGVTMKVATNNACERAVHFGEMVLHVHDEFQFDCWDHERAVIELPQAISEAGVALKLRCRLQGKATSGADWSETH